MKRILSILIFLCAMTSGAAGRTRYSINEGWQFRFGETSPSSGSDTGAWRRVDLPHTWNVDDVDDEVQGYLRGRACYKKQVMIDRPQGAERVYIYFEGVNQEAHVYVNGRLAGSHRGGYTAFCVDLTDRVTFGKRNELMVEVTNSYDRSIAPLSADFTFFGGIYRDVWMVYTSPIHLASDDYGSSGVRVRTPHADGVFKGVEILTRINSHISRRKTVRLVHTVLDAAGTEMKSQSVKVRLEAGRKDASDRTVIGIPNPRLWSVDDPYLYAVRTCIYDADSGKLLDEATTPFGFRWFRFDPDRGFWLNGKPLQLIGTSRHQDFYKKGNALSDDLHIRDVRKLKEMGGNFLRVAHYPQDPTVLEMCDRLGIIASVEIPVVNAVDSGEAFLANCRNMEMEMIRQNGNHPSVVMWGIMNETLLRIPKDLTDKEGYLAKVREIAAALDATARTEDPDRYTFLAIHNAIPLYRRAGLLDVPMVLGLNLYQGWYEADITGFERTLDRLHAQYPYLPLMVTEYGAGVDPRIHADQPERFDFSQEYGLVYHRHYYPEIRKRSYLAGASVWNLNDFYSEPRVDAVPHVNNKGLTGLDREEKDVYLYYKALLAGGPMLRIGNRHWANRACVGDGGRGVISLPVFSNAETVELQANGQRVGRRKIDNGVAFFTVPVTDGENLVAARAVVGGRTVSDALTFRVQVIPRNLRQGFPADGLHVMLGSTRYFEDRTDAVCWLPEQEYTVGSWGYVGGEVYRRSGGLQGTDADIRGTENDPIYQTQRRGIRSFKADTPDGSYLVDLHFAVLQQADPLAYNLTQGQREASERERSVFDVVVNGDTVFSDLDLVSEAGELQAVCKRIAVQARKGQGLEIRFVPKSGRPILNAIRIYRE